MSTIDDFRLGDRVKHIGSQSVGHVIDVGRTQISVRYDEGNEWTGIYDELWFRIHPDLLVNESRHETNDARRRATSAKATRI